ncbi:MAG TPA: glycoside hydrolase family 76 protein [Candidatus Acidoferrales bacterium]|jgi:predicted alpha-1,6-mannanase (GH76 family)|nr:glycoside hydrolase family 76 protein [Candidatus Acidoferrales bacterium]
MKPTNQIPFVTSCRAVTGLALALTLTAAGIRPAAAFSNADADTLFNSYNTAFYSGSGNAYYKNYKSGGDTGFWQQAEEIETAIDAANRNSSYTSQVTALVNGFDGIRQTSWSYNTYNDDVMWACIAHLRAYSLTGNTTFRNIAKSNFDMAYARSYDTVNGGFYWTSANNSKNSAVNGPASIVAYKLYQAYGDSTYLTKAQNICNWQRANCWNSTTGQVYDSPGSQTPTTYNQGTFIGANDNLGWTGGATLACNYLMTMGGGMTNGYHIMPEYGTNNNNSGFNGIGVRWAAAYMKNRGLQSSYLGWLQANAEQAWNIRRLSDGLSWCQWDETLINGDYVGSWDCSSSIAALQDVPPTE